MKRLPNVNGVAFVTLCLSLLTNCTMPGERQDFSKTIDDFVYGSLALSPVAASRIFSAEEVC